MDSIEVITEFVNNDVAVVELDVWIDNVFIGEVSGIAKRDPVDKPDQELALKLAYGRAFQKAGQRILRQANGIIKHNDDIRELKEIQKSRAKEGYSAFWNKIHTISQSFGSNIITGAELKLF